MTKEEIKEKYGYKLTTHWVLRLVVLNIEVDTLMSGQGEFYQVQGYSAAEFESEEDVIEHIVSRTGKLSVYDINNKEHLVELYDCNFIPQQSYINRQY